MVQFGVEDGGCTSARSEKFRRHGKTSARFSEGWRQTVGILRKRYPDVGLFNWEIKKVKQTKEKAALCTATLWPSIELD